MFKVACWSIIIKASRIRTSRLNRQKPSASSIMSYREGAWTLKSRHAGVRISDVERQVLPSSQSTREPSKMVELLGCVWHGLESATTMQENATNNDRPLKG